MINCYYSIRMYIENFPLTINCQDLLEMADEISELLGCEYDHLGYMLLDPDYDFKDLGITLKNNKKNREKFAGLSIPMKYYGKEEKCPAAPFVSFEVKPKDNMQLPVYVMEVEYPLNNTQYLCVKIDVKEDLLSKELTVADFKNIQDIVSAKGYCIHSSFVHYYSGNARRMILDGCECGIITVNDWRIIDHSIRFQQEWKNKVMDVFYMNLFKKEILTKDAMDEIIRIVGDKNIVEDDGKVIFKLPQAKGSYLLNRFVTTGSRRNIKKILEKENVCSKDASVWFSILRL